MPDPSAANDIDVVLGNSNPRFSGVTSTMLQTLEYQRRELNIRVLGRHHLPDPSLALNFQRAIRVLRRPRVDGKPRVFHARRNNEMIQALLLKKLFGANLRICFTSTAQRHHSRLTRWLMSKMDGIISTSQAATAYLPAAPDIIVPHGIRTDQFSPAQDRDALRAKLGLGGRIGIGIFGRVRQQKGSDVFVDACIAALPHYPGVEATIVGAIKGQDQAFVDNLCERIARAGLQQRIRFTGERPFSELPDLFRAMHIVCALSHNEGFGLTVLEAMASRAAVIATEAGAWPEIIRENVDGYVIPAGDSAALCGRLKLLLDAPEKIGQLADNGYQRVLDHYRVKHEAHRLCDFYRRLRKLGVRVKT